MAGLFVSSKQDAAGFGAAERQIALWRTQELVMPIIRSLNYRDPAHPREKGIDVALAIDFVMMATRDEFDVGVLFSEDTDLLPALEAVAQLRGPSSCRGRRWPAGSGPIRSGFLVNVWEGFTC